MTKLLKDMPECMEKVETSLSLRQEIRNWILENVEANSISEEKEAQSIIEIIAEFVNQNYEWKGVRK